MTLSKRIEEKASSLLKQENISTKDLINFLASIDIQRSDIEDYIEPDPKHPYGRRVLLNHPKLEIMLATWTRDFPCAPHDHGGSKSAIRVLRGQSHHRLFHIKEQTLKEVFSEKKSTGDILTCAPDQVHAMGDDGLEESLVTLHAYSGYIPDMLVYNDSETLVVSGACGAWIPENSVDILRTEKGHFTRKELN